MTCLLWASATHAQEGARVVTRVVTDSAPAWKTWRSDGMSIYHPVTWTVDGSATGDTLLVLQKPGDAGSGPTAATVAVQGFDGAAPTVASRLAGVADGDVEVIDGEANGNKRTEYRYKVDGVGFLRLEEVLPSGGRTFVLSYVAPEESFNEHLFLAEAMLNSFTPPGSR